MRVVAVVVPQESPERGGSNCFLPMYDYLWKDGIILSTFHGTRVYHAVSLYGLFGSQHYTKAEAFALVNPIDKFLKA